MIMVLCSMQCIYSPKQKNILRCSYENKFPNLTALKTIIRQFLLVEKSIAMRNSKITEYKHTWSSILPI